MSREEERALRTEYYVRGSAVPVPEIDIPEKQNQETREELLKKNREVARRNKERILRVDIGVCLLLITMTALLFFCAALLLTRTTRLMEKSRTVAELEVTLSELTDANIAAKERIDSAIDLGSVYTVASTQLGMKYADRSQIIYYEGSSGDYVKQFQEIPTE